MPLDKPRPLTSITATIIRLRLCVKSSWASTSVRIPMAEIMPNRMMDTPPITGLGMEERKVWNTPKKLMIMAKTAAMRKVVGL